VNERKRRTKMVLKDSVIKMFACLSINKFNWKYISTQKCLLESE